MSPERKRLTAEPRLVENEPISRGRIFLAAGLLLVMGLMWVRVLLRKHPAQAKAAPDAKSAQKAQPDAKEAPFASYVALPFVAGRHDCLGKNVFTTDNWPDFSAPARSQAVTPVNTGDPVAAEAERIVRSIAISGIMGEANAIEAFVQYEGQYMVLSPGSRLNIARGERTFEFTVTEIQSKKLVLSWNSKTYEIHVFDPITGK